MKRLQMILSISLPWDWQSLAKLDLEIDDVVYVLENMPRGSELHMLFANKIKKDLGMVRAPHYHKIVHFVAVAISGF